MSGGTSRYVAFLAGWAIVRVLALIPFVAGLVWLIVTVLGIGALVIAARQPSAARPVPRPDRAPAATN